MKTVRKLLALALAIVLMLALSAVAFAEDTATLTIGRDNSYDAAATGDRVYTWYEVFHATYGDSHEAGDEDDTYNALTGVLAELQSGADDLETGVAYYLDAEDDAAVIAKFNSETLGNLWFELTASADGSRYYVTWKNAGYTAETVQAAANWIVSNAAYVAHGDFTVSGDGTKWTAAGLEKGYYVVKGSEGANLIAVTTDMTIAEKNSYPTIDKQEKDEDQENYDATAEINDGTQTASNAAVGDVIEYRITVHVPHDTNKPIIVTDTMTAGLTYDAMTGLSFDPTLTSGTDYTAITAS